MKKKVWWHKPLLRTDEEFEIERSVTWLELFFDLVFVVVFEKISHGFGSHFDSSGVLPFVLMFCAVFWTWNATVYYVERFESEGLEIRLFTFLSMLSVTGLAVYSHNGMSDNYEGFVGAYLFARIVNMAMWARSGYHVKEFRPIAFRFIGGFSITATLLISSLFIEETVRLSLFASAIMVDIITPYFTMKLQGKLPRLSSSKFPERFGLLTIIVLGANIVEVINVLSSSHHLTVDHTIKGTMGLYIIFCVWALYFDFIARRAPKEQITVALFWVYLHLFLLAVITIIGISLSGIMETSLEIGHRFSDKVALLITTGAALVIMAVLELTLKRTETEATHHIGSPVIKIAIGFGLIIAAAIHFESGIMPLLLCCVGLTIPNIYGVKVLLSKER